MSRDGDRVRIRHMLDAAERAIRLCAGKSRVDLDGDDVFFLALTRLVEIIGEAAKAVSIQTRSRHEEIPWRRITGTRDHLIHGYFDVDRDRLWAIASADLPPLIEQLRVLLAMLDPS